jgi:uncharacterized protein
MQPTPGSVRIEVVDALRGFAIMAIMLLHNIEHFDFYYFPPHLPHWLKVFDSHVWDGAFFLFSGKAYAIFALLFGFSFYIQLSNQEKRGGDFRLRFLWRMLLLLGFGIVNSVFFEGDILAFYAVIGVVLVPVCKLSNKWVLFIAVILMAQPWLWCEFFYALVNPSALPAPHHSDECFSRAFSYLSGPSFWNLAKGNLFNGRQGALLWSWEQGRVFQTAALFMLGLLIGRKKYFVASDSSRRFWKEVLFVSVCSAIVVYVVRLYLPAAFSREALLQPLTSILSTWYNLFFMLILVSGFVLLYQQKPAYNILSQLTPFGKMSLSNYLMQSILGSLVYYGFGLALYQYTGASFSLVIGIVLFLGQLVFCRWWLAHHKQGPLEYIWHKATWVGDKLRG